MALGAGYPELNIDPWGDLEQVEDWFAQNPVSPPPVGEGGISPAKIEINDGENTSLAALSGRAYDFSANFRFRTSLSGSTEVNRTFIINPNSFVFNGQHEYKGSAPSDFVTLRRGDNFSNGKIAISLTDKAFDRVRYSGISFTGVSLYLSCLFGVCYENDYGSWQKSVRYNPVSAVLVVNDSISYDVSVNYSSSGAKLNISDFQFAFDSDQTITSLELIVDMAPQQDYFSVTLGPLDAENSTHFVWTGVPYLTVVCMAPNEAHNTGTIKLLMSSEQETKGLLTTIIEFLQGIWNGIVELPGKIVNGIKDALKALFVPSEEDMAAFKDKFTSMLESKLGFVWQTEQIIVDFGQSILTAMKGNQKYIFNFPGISIDLPEGKFEIVPKQDVSLENPVFDILQPILSTITIIICVIAFINMAGDMFVAVISGASYFEFLMRKEGNHDNS